MKNIDFKKIFKPRIVLAEKIKSKMPFENILRDWRILTLAFAVILICLSLFAWNVYLSHQIGGGYLNLNKDNSDTLVKTIDLKKLDDTLLSLEQRKLYFSTIQVEGTELTDPGR